MFRFLVLLVGLLPLISAFAMPPSGTALAASRVAPAISSTPPPAAPMPEDSTPSGLREQRLSVSEGAPGVAAAFARIAGGWALTRWQDWSGCLHDTAAVLLLASWTDAAPPAAVWNA